ncbi:MAG: hypothetical protein AB8B60_00345 [Sulfitobacter sp.]
MKDKNSDRERPSAKKDGRTLSQVVFVTVGLGIILGGLWTLYMGNAPYHPHDEVTRDGVSLTSD